MPTAHSALTGAELHEPKGVAAASANETYVADGAGSGSWDEPEPKGASGADAGDVYFADGAGSGVWRPAAEYGNIFTQESDSATLSGVGTSPITFPFTTDGPSSDNITPNAASNQITITDAGDYQISFSASLSTVSSGDSGSYKLIAAADGVQTTAEIQRYLSGTSDLGRMACISILTLAASDVITLQIESDNGGNADDINIVSAQLNVVRIG